MNKFNTTTHMDNGNSGKSPLLPTCEFAHLPFANLPFCKLPHLPACLFPFAFCLLIFAQSSSAQSCNQISFNIVNYEPCKYRLTYVNSTDCYTDILITLSQGDFASYSANMPAGFSVEVFGQSQLRITHANGFLPLGSQAPMIFTLPFGLVANAAIAYNDQCGMVGCEIFPGQLLESCPDPMDASIIGVKYRECGNLPYSSQTPLAGWTIQAFDSFGNIAGEAVTAADGAYGIYDLPAGQYIVREVQQPGWTPKVPASGEVVVSLSASQQRIVNYGNCPPPPPPCDCPNGTQPGGNVVVNGNFSGSGGFTSGYALNNSPTLQPGQYWIGSNPKQINQGFAACGDHTTGSGNMMVVNGSTSPNVPIWSQTYTMAANSTYKFEYWVASLSNASPAQLISVLQINNVLYGQNEYAPVTTCTWEKKCRVWTTNASPATITISIYNQNIAGTGNDFAIDDISFRRCVSPNGIVTGKVYQTCDSMAYFNQPTLEGQMVQLIDTMGNILSEQVTDASGGYVFADLPPANYYVKLVQQPGWTPSFPASGQVLISLGAQGQSLVQHFGACQLPTLLCNCPLGQSPGANLVTNPNFNSPGGFNTDFSLTNAPVPANGEYAILATCHTCPGYCGDHTTGLGSAFVALGTPGGPMPVYWSQQVAVVPGKKYVFTAWVNSEQSNFMGNVSIMVNGSVVGQIVALGDTGCKWKKICGVWDNPNQTSVVISITGALVTTGDRLGLDDISFRECSNSNIGWVTGTIYRTCSNEPYSNQPVLANWPVVLTDTMGNVIAEQVTDVDGRYAFYDLPKGWYWVKGGLAVPGWTPRFPASGEYLFNLQASQQLERNFGNCPACSCDSIYMNVVQLPGSSDMCSYAIYGVATGAPCFSSIHVGLGSGVFSEVIPGNGWELIVIDTQHIELRRQSPLSAYPPPERIEPASFQIEGASMHEITVSTVYNTGGGDVTCSRAVSYPCPPMPIPPPCCPSGNTFGPELVKNGDFELGAQDFTSTFNYFAPNGPYTGGYSVLNQSQVSAVSSKWACIDHTSYTPTGKMLAIQWLGQGHAWQQNINVVAGKTYSFSIWVNHLVIPTINWDDPQIALFVGNINQTQNVQLGSTFTLPQSPDQWVRLCGTWTSNTTGLVNVFVFMFGIGFNDLAIDDVSFRECIPQTTCSADIGLQHVCDGKYNFTATASGASPYIYSWDFGDPASGANNSSNLPNPTHQFSAPGIYTVTLTVFDAVGCTASATISINVPTITSPPTITGNPGFTICQGQSTTLTASGGPWANCLWSTSASGNSIAVSTSGTYCVTCTNAQGCTATDCKTVTVNPLPQVSIAGNLNICTGQSTTLTATGGGSYLWSPGGQTTAAITVMPLATNTYTVVVTANGCTKSATATVTVGLTPAVSISPFNPSVCQGGSQTLTASGTNGSQYTWSPGNQTGATVSVNTAVAGTYTYVVTANLNGCTATSNVIVTVKPVPTVSISGPTSICDGATATFTASSLPGSSYVWSIGGFTTPAITVNPPGPGTYSYTVTATLNGCTATAAAPLTVKPLPTVMLRGNSEICEGDVAYFLADATAGSTYLWSPGGETTDNIAVNQTTPGTYTYTLTVSLNGCSVAETKTIKVLDCDCDPNAVIKNGSFVLGIKPGSIIYNGGTAAFWNGIATPQVVTDDGYKQLGCIQMWGNQVVGEGIIQPASIQPGCTYEVSYAARAFPTTGPQPVRLRLRATAGNGISFWINYFACPNNNCSEIALSPPLTQNWQHYSTTWTAPTGKAFDRVAATVWNNSNVNSAAFTSWLRVDSICIVKKSCPDECVCGTFDHTGFGYEKGSFTSMPCDAGTVFNLQCALPGQRFWFTGSFACMGNSCPASSNVDWELWRVAPGATTLVDKNTVSAGPYFGIPMIPSYFTVGGTYEMRLKGSCGGAACPPCIIKFTMPACPVSCACTDLKKEVDKGFYRVYAHSKCRMCFTPTALQDCDQVSWFVEPVDTNFVNQVGATTGRQSFCFDFPGGGAYTVTMKVARKQPDGTMCMETFSKNVYLNCGDIPLCESEVFLNPDFGAGGTGSTLFGVLGEAGYAEDWVKVAGSPVVKDTSDQGGDDWCMMLLGNDDVYDAISTNASYCLEKDTGTLTIKAKLWRNDEPPPKQEGLMLFVNLVRGSAPITFPCEGDDCYELACLQFPEGSDDSDWMEFQVDYDLRDLAVSDTNCNNIPGQAINVRPVLYVGNHLHDVQGGSETYSQVLLDYVCLNGRGMVPTISVPQRPALRIFPNPNLGRFSVELPAPAVSGASFQITDLAGRLVLVQRAEVGNKVHSLRVEGLPCGLYFLKLVAEGKVLAVEKFVKQ